MSIHSYYRASKRNPLRDAAYLDKDEAYPRKRTEEQKRFCPQEAGVRILQYD